MANEDIKLEGSARFFSANSISEFDDIALPEDTIAHIPLWTKSEQEIPQELKTDTKNIQEKQARVEGEGNATERVKWFTEPRNFPDPENLTLREDIAQKTYQESKRLAQLDLLEDDNLELSRGLTGTRWRLLGPGNFSGRVNAIAVDPNNTRKIIVCTASGGVWMSTNGGSTWRERNNGLGSNFTGAVSIDPRNSNIIFVGTGDQDIRKSGVGLFRSVNGGASFRRTSLNNIAWASKIIFNPQDSQIIYVGSNRGVYKSVDGGATWSLVFNEGQVNDLIISPSHPRILFVGVRGKGVYRTLNHGRSWSKMDVGPSSFRRVRMAICDNHSHHSFASFDEGGKVRLYKTANWGSDWTEITNVPQAGWGQLWYNHYVAVKPNNPNVIYTGQGTIYRTTDGGRNWAEINKPITNQYTYIHVDHHCLTFDPNNPNTIYGGCDGGIYRSKFGGNYWEYIGASIPCSEFYAMGQSTKHPYLIGGGTQDNGTWLTDGSYNRWRHILGGDGFYFRVDPRNSKTMYAEAQYLNVHRSDNGGESFQRKKHGIMEADLMPWMGRIELDQRRPDTVYVGTDRIYKSTNKMESWTRLNCGDNIVLISHLKGESSRVEIAASSTADTKLGLSGRVTGSDDSNGNPKTFARMISSLRAPFNLAHGDTLRIKVNNGSFITVTFSRNQFANISRAQAWEVANVINSSISNLHAGASARNAFTAIRVAPSNSNVIYAAASDQIWKSLNGGSSWQSIKKAPLPQRWISDIDIAADNYNEVMITCSGRGTNHVYYSNNGGGSWQSRSAGLPDTPTNTILIDPSRSSKVYVGTDLGVYESANKGSSWRRYSEGIPQVVITDLHLHKNTGMLRASTYGRGIYERKVNDISVRIRSIRTANQRIRDIDYFRYSSDALTLVIDIGTTQDMLDINPRYDAYFQIIDPRTNKVIKNIKNNNSRFSHGRYFWISRGNNWGPNASDYTTPQKWGLGRGTYIFRAGILVEQTDAFTTSADKWFRVI